MGQGVVRLSEFDHWVRKTLPMDEFSRLDASRNGLQVARSNPRIARVAVAVDAVLATFERAVEWKADLLFVHHGLFWGREEVLCGPHYQRIRYLIEHDLALYAVHLPLDADLTLGNNVGIAKRLALTNVRPFGTIKGAEIGVRGETASAMRIEEAVDALYEGESHPLAVLPFGPQEISSVGIISGGAPLEVDQAITAGLDLYISGDANHVAYHRCREAGINAIFGGHYATEVWGVRQVAQRITSALGLETTFLDHPTGM